MKKSRSESNGFEKGMVHLKTISEQLESGELSLDDSLQAFEEGIRIYRSLNQSLNAAELRIRTIMEEENPVLESHEEGGK